MTANKWPRTHCCHVIPALDEAHVEDEVIRRLPLANKRNLPLQILANRWSPANEKPKHYQEYDRQHPHDPSTGHVWNPLGCSREEHFQNPGIARHQNVKANLTTRKENSKTSSFSGWTLHPPNSTCADFKPRKPEIALLLFSLNFILVYLPISILHERTVSQ